MSFAPYNTKPGARRMPDDLAEELVRVHSELRTQHAALAKRQSERQSGGCRAKERNQHRGRCLVHVTARESGFDASGIARAVLRVHLADQVALVVTGARPR